MTKELETVYVDFGDISAQATIERLVELVGIEAVKSAVDEIASQQNAHPTLGESAPLKSLSTPEVDSDLGNDATPAPAQVA